MKREDGDCGGPSAEGPTQAFRAATTERGEGAGKGRHTAYSPLVLGVWPGKMWEHTQKGILHNN
jgi:hypothetical protein